MGTKASKRIALRPETKDWLDERKPEGETFDRYIRRLLEDSQI